MYSDNTLTPREAIRLCALGTLAANSTTNSSPMAYDDLAHSVRHFVSRITGPSLELMGESIELLRFEGLASTTSNVGTPNPDLIITEAGITALKTLLVANIRPGGSELNELVFALKFRFIHHLEKMEQISQVDLIIEVCEVELVRFEDLHNYHNSDAGHITGWLDHSINHLKNRLNWLYAFKSELEA
ncbi:MAG: hypothetical protein VX693_00935 [Pseudomonadota bacterium]|nr:hypothetical protein [Pseudomonadota bacterium]